MHTAGFLLGILLARGGLFLLLIGMLLFACFDSCLTCQWFVHIEFYFRNQEISQPNKVTIDLQNYLRFLSFTKLYLITFAFLFPFLSVFDLSMLLTAWSSEPYGSIAFGKFFSSCSSRTKKNILNSFFVLNYLLTLFLIFAGSASLSTAFLGSPSFVLCCLWQYYFGNSSNCVIFCVWFDFSYLFSVGRVQTSFSSGSSTSGTFTFNYPASLRRSTFWFLFLF